NQIMADVKTAAAKPQGHAGKPKNTSNFMINLLIVIACVAICEAVFHLVFGAPSNFKDAERHVPANGLGTVYSGGWVVPILMSTCLTLIAFVVERALTIVRAKGKMNAGEFVRKVQYHLANKNMDAALAECDKQAGSVGNVMRAGLVKYR